ncbi:A-kinase anchor protein 1 [Cricetulus griseus]|nr:A-kinase anchor protein 1 [Cricetulus griseus]
MDGNHKFETWDYVLVETLKVGPVIKDQLPSDEACPRVLSMPPSVAQPPETEQLSVGKSSTALPRIRQVRRRSESSGNLPSNVDTRSQPCRDNNSKVELSLMGDEVKSIPLGCPLLPKEVPFPYEAVEGYKQESALGKIPGRGWLDQCAASGEKARETGGAEGTGDAVLGENIPEEGLLSQEYISEVEKSGVPNLAPWGGGGEKMSSGPPQVAELAKKEEFVVGKLPSSFVEPVRSEMVKDEDALVPQVRGGITQDRDLAREQIKEDTLPEKDQIEQAAFQIISRVILEVTEEMGAGKTVVQVYPTSVAQPQGLEESSVPASQETGLGRDIPDPVSTTTGATASPPAEALPPKTYVSCFSSPLSSPTKDQKPKTSAHHISLAPCPLPVTRLRQSLDAASSPGGDDTFVTCMSYNKQSVLSVTSSGQRSHSLTTSGLEDSCTKTISSPGDKAVTPPLPDSTEPFSNGVLKEELSDVGTEDGWTMDAEADHSGGSDRNSMDSVDSCCGLPKPDSLQNVQASSNPKKVDLIVWEIEVPKLMLPDGVTVEVIVVNQVNAGHLFVQQHTHPTFHALRSLDQQMYLCYSQPGIPTLPTPVEITVICAAPGADGAWWRAQVVASYEETNEVEIRYVDYGGYKRVKVDVLRQIRSDFVTLPFQGAEVLLDSVVPLSDDDHFSPEADAAMSEMTGNTALLAQRKVQGPLTLVSYVYIAQLVCKEEKKRQ